ncbi:MAG: CBS domain-containing protein, partial [Gammaproteobacteria bacterium]|nr:CBS domain-containing protein [Gammaproteobacteria bacterium]
YVEQIMSRELDTITAERKVSHAGQLMREKNRRYLPVIDNDHQLVGLFGLKHLAQAEPSAITTLSVGEVNYLTSKLTVGKLMQKDPITCAPRTLIEKAGQIIRENKIGCLPVLDGGRLVGVVSETDILDFFLDISGSLLNSTTRIAVRVPNRARELANFLNRISDGGGYIATVISPTQEESDHTRTVIVRFTADNPDQVDASLREAGYNLVTEDLP